MSLAESAHAFGRSGLTLDPVSLTLDVVAPVVSTAKQLAFAIAVELGTSFIDHQRAPAVSRAVHRANGILRLPSAVHLDECKSARRAGVAIRDNRDGLNYSVGRE